MYNIYHIIIYIYYIGRLHGCLKYIHLEMWAFREYFSVGRRLTIIQSRRLSNITSP